MSMEAIDKICAVNDEKMILIGCGILKKEILLLIEKNNWQLDTFFLDSSLHVDFEALSGALRSCLLKYKCRNIIVFYGACHPLMHNILQNAGVHRTEGQNCIDMLLGGELFYEELSKGAFFLLEDWVDKWDEIVLKTFGENSQAVKEIYKMDRNYFLCIRTPASKDFSESARVISESFGLPVNWIDVDLSRLELVLENLIISK